MPKGSRLKRSRLWKREPEAKDFEAAQRFLSLVCPASRAARLVNALRTARTVEHAAKDLLRASALPLLRRDASRVAADLKRISKGKPLSPVLLIEGDLAKAVPLLIADGYHRVCAVCYYDEDAPVACRLTRFPGQSSPRRRRPRPAANA
jgi:hypothetical protein